MNPLAIVFVILGVWIASVGFRNKQGALFSAFTGTTVGDDGTAAATAFGGTAGTLFGQVGAAIPPLAKQDQPPYGKGAR